MSDLRSGGCPRIIFGTETEFGIVATSAGGCSARFAAPGNAITWSTELVRALATVGDRADPVLWDYTAEDPLNDLRGHRLERAGAHASQLTDDPYRLAAGGLDREALPGQYEWRRQGVTNLLLENGGRFYVDHAHPEYSSPETTTARHGALYDRAGDLLARTAVRQARANGITLRVFKNNTDGKGAAYGTHENYRIAREVDFATLVTALTAFLVTRPVICGAGRVGLGQRGERAGFQISQRADFIENEVGLETTFNRPIINTRDEPHADPATTRRFHVINADANQFDFSTYLRLGTTALVLKAVHCLPAVKWEGLTLSGDPVQVAHRVSHDLEFATTYPLRGGRSWSAVRIQRAYADLVTEISDCLDDEEIQVLECWLEVLDGFDGDRRVLADRVEWVAKWELFERQRQRWRTHWGDSRLAALDLQWADLEEDRNLVVRLRNAGLVRSLWSAAEVEAAMHCPPQDTRARLRGLAVKHLPSVVRASWSSVVLAEPPGSATRIPLPDPEGAGAPDVVAAIKAGQSAVWLRSVVRP